MSDSFHRIPALSKWALKGKQRKMEVTQEELQVQKKGAGWMLAKPNILKMQTKKKILHQIPEQPLVTVNI